MFRTWASEAGMHLQLQRRVSGRSFLYLFDAKRSMQCVFHKEYDYHQRHEAEAEAAALARLGVMEETTNEAA